MKVGVDGVTLGAWADVSKTHNILDIGTGSGLIALMLAQRSNALIDAIDIDSNAVIQASENVRKSPWANRINVSQTSFQDYSAAATKKYDLIVSNPPFFNDSLKNPDEYRSIARHTDSLPHKDLLSYAKELLNPEGRISIILPVKEGLSSISFAQTINLNCNKIVYLHPNPHKEAKRVLLEFGCEITKTEISKLTIETNIRQEYTSEYTQMVKDFYLKL